MVRSVPLVLAAYNDSMVDALADRLRPFLRSGDEVDLVSGNRDRAVSLDSLNEWVARLRPVVPSGVTFAAHTSSLDKVQTIAQGASPEVRSVLLDYEPNWDPAFVWDFRTTLAHFDQFARLCRASGRRAVAYPTGRPLREGPLQAYGWSYGELRRHVDEVYPQTQHWAMVGTDAWTSVLDRLRSDWAGHGFDPRSLTVQLTIGNRENGISSAKATARYRAARLPPEGRLYLWWSPEVVDDVEAFLRSLDTPP